jgi:hypothetical protein
MCDHNPPRGEPLGCFDQVRSAPDVSAAKRPDGTEWSDPADLWASSESSPYPLSSFPEIPRNAIAHHQRYAKQPIAMVGGAALAQMALAAQGHADVARDERLIGPISLNQLVLGDSGERKTAADKQFSRGARIWQREKREELLNDHRRAKAMERDHRARIDGVKKRITALAHKDSDEDKKESERQRERLVDLEQNPILFPPLPVLTYEDVTPAALAYALGTGWPSAGLFSDEAGAVVARHGRGHGDRIPGPGQHSLGRA